MKRLFTLLLTLILIVILAAPAMATEQTFSFDLRKVTTDQETHGIKWEAKSKTLTVEELSLDVSGQVLPTAAVYLPAGSTLILEGGGVTSISISETGVSAVIGCDGDLTVKGNGTLKLSGARDGINAVGNINVEGINLDIYSPVNGEASTGLLSQTGSITIKDAVISAEAYVPVASASGSVTIENSKIDLIGALYGVDCDKDLIVNDSELSASGGDSGIFCMATSGEELGSASFKNSIVKITGNGQSGIYCIKDITFENCDLFLTGGECGVSSAMSDITFKNTDAYITGELFPALSVGKIILEKTQAFGGCTTEPINMGEGMSLSVFHKEFDLVYSVQLNAQDSSLLPKEEVVAPEAPYVPTIANPFTDVSKSDYYYDAVLWAVEQGVTTGTTATTFGPDATCTRGQAVTFLWRAMGSPEPTSTNNPFTDVNSTDYFYKPVLWAVEQGITNGTSATTFSPYNTVTREQTLTFLYRAVGEPDYPGMTEQENDADNSYSFHPVSWALSTGVAGYIKQLDEQNRFFVNISCPRAEIVYFIYKALNA